MIYIIGGPEFGANFQGKTYLLINLCMDLRLLIIWGSVEESGIRISSISEDLHSKCHSEI
jgi:hypothetical protein